MDKRDLRYFSPVYVDGIEKLHRQLYESYEKAIELSSRMIGTSKPKTNIEQFHIFVDCNEEQPENMLKGYFMFNGIIHRFLPITFDMALIFPVHNHGGGKFETLKGVTYNDIREWKDKRLLVRLSFGVERDDDNKPFHRILRGIINLHSTGLWNKIDDIGFPIYSFPDIDYIRITDIPIKFTTREYTLVGKQYYAPYSKTDESYCVLFAQLDNEYDTNAIKVLRWIPMKKGIEIDQLLGLAPDGGDVFFELGYISRQENSELHSFMVENNSRLLFAKNTENQISILGGVKIFQTNNLKYPKCLYNIKLT